MLGLLRLLQQHITNCMTKINYLTFFRGYKSQMMVSAVLRRVCILHLLAVFLPLVSLSSPGLLSTKRCQ